MAAKHFRPVFTSTLTQEAGFQQMAKDPGNFCGGKLIGTKYGVGAQAYKAFYKACPTVAAMKNLTVEQAAQIWKKTVWDNIQGDAINSEGVCAMLLYATGGGKSGYTSMRECINEVAGKEVVTVSSVGKITAEEVKFINANTSAFFYTFYKIRLAYYQNSKNRAYVKGWVNRLNAIYNKYKNSVTAPVKNPYYFNPALTIAF